MAAPHSLGAFGGPDAPGDRHRGRGIDIRGHAGSACRCPLFDGTGAGYGLDHLHVGAAAHPRSESQLRPVAVRGTLRRGARTPGIAGAGLGRGIVGFYATLAGLALLLAAVGLHIQSGHDRGALPSAISGTSDLRAGIAGLAAILAFYVGFSALWTFTAQMASPAVGAGAVSRALSIAPIGGMAGAALAGAIGTRFGAVRPFAVAVLALGAAAAILGLRPEWVAYQAASCGVLLGWTFGVPFLFGGVAHVDASGRLTTAINIIVGTGLAAGPALGALLVVSRDITAAS